MKVAKAWAPGNISCVFKVHRGKTAMTSGSSGWGFTVDKGVSVSVHRSQRTTILLDGRGVTFPTVRQVIKELAPEPVMVDIKSALPLGSGFGVSGASALATAYALKKLLGLKKSKLELAKIAHGAEVENGTGLGDVINQFYGGVCVKFRSSHHFVVSRPGVRSRAVHYRIFSSLDTKSVISSKQKWERLNKEASKAIRRLRQGMRSGASFERMLDISREFAEDGGLMKNASVKKTIAKITKGSGHATMIMLGNAVLSDKPFPGSKTIKISRRGAL